MFSFPKKERLCSYSRIQELFAKGDAFLVYPFSVRYMIDQQGEGKARVMIVCPKRYQRLAVNRNLTKRRMREAYRLNNTDMKSALKEKGCNIDFALSYVAKNIFDYHHLEEKMKEVLANIEAKIMEQENI